MDLVVMGVLFFILCTLFLLILVLTHYIMHKIENNSKDKMKDRLKNLIVNINDNETKVIFTKLLKKVNNLLLFEELYVEDSSIINFEDNIDVIAELSVFYAKKSEYKRIYFSYFLAYINVDHPEISKFLDKAIDTNEISGIDKVLLITLKQGNYDHFLMKLHCINNDNIDYSAKLLSDQMLEYTGDKKELAFNLIASYSEFNSNIRRAIIIFSRYIKYDKYKSILKLYKIEEDKECRLSMIRYFSSSKFNGIDKELIDTGLSTDDFEYKVVILQSLEKYNSKRSLKYLYDNLNDENYYVMSSALGTLNKLTDISVLKEKYNENVDRHIDFLLSNGGM